ncbi:MAG: lytic transglycosylase domain-containing protein [Bacteroidales bacterium]|nr:lytic transglycosylase domain-containing protein [Bacteroidales bacterium]
MKNKISHILLVIGIILSVVIICTSTFQLFVHSNKEDGDSLYVAEMKSKYSNYCPVLPEEIDFCGERVPIENFDVRESLEKEIIKVMYWHSETYLYIKRANRYFPAMRKILKENNIPEDFLFLCVVESGMDNVVSPAKAVGFWQILEATAKDAGLEVNDEVDERYDFEKSTLAACKYLRQAYNKFHSWTSAAAAYNCGQGGLNKLINQQGENNYYNLKLYTETGRYVYRILAFKLILSNPDDYGFCYRQKDLYEPIETETVEVDSAITNLYDFGKKFSGNYKVFKILNPWLRDTKLTNKDKKTYKIKVLADGAREKEYEKYKK